MLGKIQGKRRRGWQRMRWLVSIADSMDMNWLKIWEIMEDRGGWHAAVHDVANCEHDSATGQQRPPPPEKEAVGSKNAAMSQSLNSASDFPYPTRHNFANKLFLYVIQRSENMKCQCHLGFCCCCFVFFVWLCIFFF